VASEPIGIRLPTPPPLRRIRLALRISAWSISLTLTAAATGVLLFIHRGDAEGSARMANGEIEYVLQRNEVVERRAPVRQRNWYEYFRVTHGVLAATDRRLLYVGVPPEPLLPREEEPRELETVAITYDRPVDARRTRLFLGAYPGVIVTTPGSTFRFLTPAAQRDRLDSVLALVRAHQAVIRDAEEHERQAAISAAVTARLPRLHVVQRGEALEVIARLYNTTVDDLRSWNGLTTDALRAGRVLVVKPWS
jgi:hypothetical protein